MTPVSPLTAVNPQQLHQLLAQARPVPRTLLEGVEQKQLGSAAVGTTTADDEAARIVANLYGKKQQQKVRTTTTAVAAAPTAVTAVTPCFMVQL